MKKCVFALVISICPLSFVQGCKKPDPGAPPRAEGSGRPPPTRSRVTRDNAAPILTKEEVGAIIGVPVTSIEGTGTNLTYKTGDLYIETKIELEERDEDGFGVQSMKGAHTATGFLGGTAENVPGLGDEAFFGAMSFLYVRKGNAFATIVPPNLGVAASAHAMEKVMAAPIEDKARLMQELVKNQQGTPDPMQAGLGDSNAMKGAVTTIGAMSKKQGTPLEAKERAMAVALATKLMEKL